MDVSNDVNQVSSHEGSSKTIVKGRLSGIFQGSSSLVECPSSVLVIDLSFSNESFSDHWCVNEMPSIESSPSNTFVVISPCGRFDKDVGLLF